MSLKMVYFVLLSVFGASVMSGCRSNKSAFSYASPPPSTTSYAAYAPVESQSNAVPDQLPTMTPPATAATYSSPAGSSYAPANYSPAPSKASSGCSSGCCSG